MLTKFIPTKEEDRNAGVLLSSHFRKSYGYYGYRPEGMHDWLLIYTLSGEGTVKALNKTFVCQEGQATLIPPDLPHLYATSEGAVWEILWVHFQPLSEWITWLNMLQTGAGIIHFSVDSPHVKERIVTAFKRLIVDSQFTDSATIQLSFVSLSEILLLIYRSHVQSEIQVIDDRIKQAMHYMTERLSEHLTLNEIATTSGLSVSRLCHLYKEQVGESVMNTLLRMRLQKAAKLLQFTTHTVQEIAYDSGFDSPFYFSKQFKQHYKSTPTQYRKQMQE